MNLIISLIFLTMESKIVLNENNNNKLIKYLRKKRKTKNYNSKN